jgi:hypothetical protein
MFSQLRRRKFEVVVDCLHRPEWYFLRVLVYEDGCYKGTLDLDESWFTVLLKLNIHQEWTGAQILQSGGNGWLDHLFEPGPNEPPKYYYLVATAGGYSLHSEVISSMERTQLIEHDKHCNPKDYNL